MAPATDAGPGRLARSRMIQAAAKVPRRLNLETTVNPRSNERNGASHEAALGHGKESEGSPCGCAVVVESTWR